MAKELLDRRQPFAERQRTRGKGRTVDTLHTLQRSSDPRSVVCSLILGHYREMTAYNVRNQ